MTVTEVQAPNGSHNGVKSSIQAKLNFYLDPKLGGHTSFNASTAGAFRRKFDEHEVPIHDVRALKNKEFNLQQHGFQFCKQAVPAESLQEAMIKSELYPRTVDLIKEMFDPRPLPVPHASTFLSTRSDEPRATQSRPRST
ncbi:hypothetical protein NLG97_g5732 [Lecanicillium saksenae]|uniref:Uncharacterized protein n=1 Tax=Lecanicillium saksenae TaxID=468837 RepID=A0ACC1QRL1_9HYPO|nr:hypothetical protein NLG97_g5732 [Lecanicillium saksenae]